MGLFDIFKRKQVEIVKQENQDINVMSEKPLGNVEDNFLMIVEDVFKITGRGTIVTGHISSGCVQLNDILVIEQTGKTVAVAGIEMFRKSLDYAQAGDNVGLLLREISKEDVPKGTKLVK